MSTIDSDANKTLRRGKDLVDVGISTLGSHGGPGGADMIPPALPDLLRRLTVNGDEGGLHCEDLAFVSLKRSSVTLETGGWGEGWIAKSMRVMYLPRPQNLEEEERRGTVLVLVLVRIYMWALRRGGMAGDGGAGRKSEV